MRRSTWVTSLALAILCLCVLALFVSRAHRRLSGQSALESPSARPDSKVLLDRLNVSPAHVSPLAASVPKLGFEPKRSVGIEDLPYSIRDWVSGRAVFLDSVIRSQEPDDVWAASMRDCVQGAFRDQATVSVDSVECGQTLCRIEVLGTTPGDSGTEQARLALARVAPANSEQTLRATLPPASPKLVVYMTRENTPLPNLLEKYGEKQPRHWRPKAREPHRSAVP